MNPVFWMIVILILIFMWFVLSFMFPWLGKMFKRLWDDTMYNIYGKEGEDRDER